MKVNSWYVRELSFLITLINVTVRTSPVTFAFSSIHKTYTVGEIESRPTRVNTFGLFLRGPFHTRRARRRPGTRAGRARTSSEERCEGGPER
ncbi:hypothetical protein EVAR_62883_1 [Eumeta japonica]|uniref:Uncharacterized protein n=1 Tax=Eumeta variegata TaxID=151549 RepID=A0A4C1ZXV3_EUMVA|nr:hypothetical protein EVAR_62883_1 [Eumeta japonica]